MPARWYTSPRPTGPEPSDSEPDTTVSVSDTGAIRETRPDGVERWSATSIEGAEEISRTMFGPDTEVRPARD